MSSASIGAIIRAVVGLEADGAEYFFGEPGLSVNDWLTLGESGKGMINILDSSSLILNGRLYSTFLLWLLSELFETLPEVGDLAKPKMVFFFDEAHLLFDGTPRILLDKIEQVVKLIRSKGVGVYFCTQNPSDIPDGVLAQLGNKVQHALRAYTPKEQKNVKAAAESFRQNPEFDTYNTLLELGVGEAVISFLDENGVPSVAQKASILPPKSRMGSISDAERERSVKSSLFFSKYYEAVDPDSAYEKLNRQEAQEAAEKEKAELERKEFLEKEKAAAAEEKEKAREEAKKAQARKRAVSSVGNTVTGTIGREVGKQIGKGFGKFGKTLGGNLGASLGRGLFGTLFKK
jgi:hypothetical protein